MTGTALDWPFVHATGDSLSATIESHPNPEQVDHVWIRMDVGIGQLLTIAVNTISFRNRDAGFDPRVRVSFLRGTWTQGPLPGIERCHGFDYQSVESHANLYYEPMERPDLETLLLSTTARATFLEAWGVPYHHRTRPGLHQIHSRRASCAVAEDIQKRDGALQFYFPDHTTSLFLFKFCGQP